MWLMRHCVIILVWSHIFHSLITQLIVFFRGESKSATGAMLINHLRRFSPADFWARMDYVRENLPILFISFFFLSEPRLRGSTPAGKRATRWRSSSPVRVREFASFHPSIEQVIYRLLFLLDARIINVYSIIQLF